MLTHAALISEAHRPLADVIPLRDMLRVWSAVGNEIARCLRRSKGVVLEGLGIFTLNERGAPKFILNPAFARKYRVQDADAKRTLARSESLDAEAPPPTGVVPNGKLSLSAITTRTGGDIARPVISKVLSEICAKLGLHAVRRLAPLCVSFGEMGQLVMTDGFAKFAFSGEFLDGIRRIGSDAPETQMAFVARRHLRSGDAKSGGARRRTKSSHADAPARTDGGPGADKPDHVRSVRGALCAASGYEAFLTLRDVLYAVDVDADGRVTAGEVEVALRECGVALSGDERRGLLTTLGFDDADTVSSLDVLDSIRAAGGLSDVRRDKRRALAADVYARLAAAAPRAGVVTLRFLHQEIEGDWHPEVQTFAVPEDALIARLLARFNVLGGARINPDAFESFYGLMSGGIDDDAFYTQMLTESYPRVVAGSGSAASKPTAPPDGGPPAKSASGAGPRAAWGEEGAPLSISSARASTKLPLPRFTPDMLDFNLSDPMRELRRLLFDPPISLVELSKTLRVSGVVGATTIAVPALASRLQKRAAALGEALPFMTARRYAETASAGGADTEAVADVAWLHQELSRRFGRDPEAKRPRAIVDRVKKNIMAVCGGEGLKGLKRELAAMVAHDDHGQLSKYELAAGLEDKGISLNNRELGEVFRHFDADHSGAVTYAEFITGVRGTMSGLRRAQVDVTYDFLERQGATTLKALLAKYDGSWHPAARAGLVSPKAVEADFEAELAQLLGDETRVTREHFVEIFEDLSYLIEGDDFFELMIRNGFHFAPTVDPKKQARGLAPEPVKEREVTEGEGWRQRGYVRRSRRDAALNVQRTVRGHKGRTEADREQRKVDAETHRAFEEEQEQDLARARPPIRRAPIKSQHGF